MLLHTTCKQSDLTIHTNIIRGLVQWFVEISMQILLSSNVRQVYLGVLMWALKSFPFSSYSRFKITITSLRAVDGAM